MKKIFMLLPFLAILLASACGNPANNETATSDTKQVANLEKVRLLLAADGNAMYYTYIARENGYFKDEGLEVELVSGKGGAHVVEQLGTETADIGIVAVPSLLQAWNKDMDIQAVYQINSTNLFDCIIPRYSDIKSFSQLKGKVIGVTDFAGAEVPFVQSLLARSSLNVEQDVTLRAMGAEGPTIAKAFENGEIAAFCGGAHDLVNLYAMGFKTKSLIPKIYNSLPSTAIIANGKIIKQRPDLVEKITRAIARGIDFSINNREAAFEIMKSVVPEEYNNEMVGQLCLNTFIDLSTPIETEKGYGFIYLDSWRKLVDLYSSGKDPVITSEIDLTKYLNTRFLEKANNFKK